MLIGLAALYESCLSCGYAVHYSSCYVLVPSSFMAETNHVIVANTF